MIMDTNFRLLLTFSLFTTLAFLRSAERVRTNAHDFNGLPHTNIIRAYVPKLSGLFGGFLQI